MQLCPQFCRRIVATCSAWYAMSASLHSPGTTMMGETPPSSAVIGFFSGNLLGRPVRLAELGHLLYSLEDVENYHIFSPITKFDSLSLH